MKSTRQLSVSKTAGEWSLIDKKVKESGKSDLNTYIRCEAIKLKNAFTKSPSCITNAEGERIEKRPYLPVTIYEELNVIAVRMRVPVSTVIDRLIIEPMLLPKL